MCMCVCVSSIETIRWLYIYRNVLQIDSAYYSCDNTAFAECFMFVLTYFFSVFLHIWCLHFVHCSAFSLCSRRILVASFYYLFLRMCVYEFINIQVLKYTASSSLSDAAITFVIHHTIYEQNNLFVNMECIARFN